jgi:hypothetical protein
MKAKKIFYITLIFSIIVQVITGILQLGTFYIKVPPMYFLIRQLMVLDLLIQLVEGLFYVWLSYYISNISNITPKRYIDWIITTPTMLVTLIFYLIYINQKVENKTSELEFFNLLHNHSSTIIKVLCLNWAMLLCGYLSELQYIPVLLGVGMGFIPFLIYYYIIYVNYVNQDSILFWYFFFFWSLYGVAAMLPYYLKNAFYNILDLFSKNFFGLFLSYIIFFGHY